MSRNRTNHQQRQRQRQRLNRAIVGGRIRNHVSCDEWGNELESKQHAKRHRIRSAKQLATLGIHVSCDDIGVIVRGLNSFGCPLRARGQTDNLAPLFWEVGRGEYYADQSWRFPYPPGGGDDFSEKLNTLLSYVFGLSAE